MFTGPQISQHVACIHTHTYIIIDLYGPFNIHNIAAIQNIIWYKGWENYRFLLYFATVNKISHLLFFSLIYAMRLNVYGLQMIIYI